MKSLISVFVFLSFLSVAKAETLLQCNLAEKDLTSVTISKTSDGIFAQEFTRRGSSTPYKISEDSWNDQRIRLSDSEMGFRFLEYTYSNIFGETDWFVISDSGLDHSESRAYCK